MNYSEEVQNKLDTIEEKIWDHEEAIRKLKRETEVVECGESPIKVGDIITWETGKGGNGKPRRGKVVSVSTGYKEYEYRVNVLSKAGKSIGFATVGSSRVPVLEGHEE